MLVDELRAIVGSRHVLTGDLTVANVTDWTGRWRASAWRSSVPPTPPRWPRSSPRAAADTPVVPQGATPACGRRRTEAGQVVLSTARPNAVGEVDAAVGQLTAGAGATVEAVDAAARCRLAVRGRFAARATATIGGTIATNAGGHHVLRHGMTRRHVVGIEAVLADGTVVSHPAVLVKDNTGYDLAALLCGSEGTLAVVTAALALVPPGRAGRRFVGLPGLAEVATRSAPCGAAPRRSRPSS